MKVSGARIDFSKSHADLLDIHMEKNLDPASHYTHVNLKWIIDINVKGRTKF